MVYDLIIRFFSIFGETHQEMKLLHLIQIYLLLHIHIVPIEAVVLILNTIFSAFTSLLSVFASLNCFSAVFYPIFVPSNQ